MLPLQRLPSSKAPSGEFPRQKESRMLDLHGGGKCFLLTKLIAFPGCRQDPSNRA